MLNTSFLFETSDPFKYQEGHQFFFGNGKAAKQIVHYLTNQFNFDRYEILEKVDDIPNNAEFISVPEKPTSDEYALYLKRLNNTFIEILGPKSLFTGLLVRASKPNNGEITEAILGAAIFAKLINRGSNAVEQITADHIKSIFHILEKRKLSEYTTTVEDQNSTIADKITFDLNVSPSTYLFLIDEQYDVDFNKWYNGAVAYANSRDSQRYSNLFYTNQKADTIVVRSDGLSDQKNRKTDVQVFVADENGNPQRILRNLDLSVKFGSDMFSQHGAGGEKESPSVWFRRAQELFAPIFNAVGVELQMPSASNNIRDFYIELFKNAATQLNHIFEHGNNTQDANIISSLSNFIIQHGVGSAQKGSRIINLKGGSYSLHNFHLLLKNLTYTNVNLAARYKFGTINPSIIIFDKNRKDKDSILFQLRFTAGEQSGKTAIYIEQGPLLRELTNVTSQANTPLTKSAPTGNRDSRETPISPKPVVDPEVQDQDTAEIDRIRNLYKTNT